MARDKTAIYICDLFPPYLSIDFQEDTCRIICKQRNFNNVTVIKDEQNSKANLNDLLENSNNYKQIIIYTFSCLGNSLKEIEDFVKKILTKNITLISISDPVDLNKFGIRPSENLLLTMSIAYGIHNNEMWKDILESKED